VFRGRRHRARHGPERTLASHHHPMSKKLIIAEKPSVARDIARGPFWSARSRQTTAR
jgi:hypothetical protein